MSLYFTVAVHLESYSVLLFSCLGLNLFKVTATGLGHIHSFLKVAKGVDKLKSAFFGLIADIACTRANAFSSVPKPETAL